MHDANRKIIAYANGWLVSSVLVSQCDLKWVLRPIDNPREIEIYKDDQTSSVFDDVTSALRWVRKAEQARQIRSQELILGIHS